MRICAFDVYVQKKKKKKAKAMWSLRHTWLERAVPSPPFIKLFFPFILCINKYIFYFSLFHPLFGVNDNMTTRQHISRGGTLLSPTHKKKKKNEEEKYNR